jgi:O-antigen/teichoic acid export membrane protein
MVLLRLLTRTEYAVGAVLDVLISLMAFTSFGLNTVFLQRAPAGLCSESDRSEALGLIKLAILVRFGVACLVALLMIVLSQQISILFLKTTFYSMHVRLLAFGAISAAMLESFMHICQAAQDFGRLSRWMFWTNIWRSPAGLALFLIFGLWGYLLGIVGFIVLSTCIIGWKVRNYWFNNVPIAPLWPTIRYGFPYYLRTFFRFGFLQADQMLVAILLTPDILAMYAVARRFVGYINQATEALLQPVLMRVTALRETTDNSIAQVQDKLIRYIPITIISLSTCVAVSSPWLMRIIGGAKYADGWPLLMLLCLAQICYLFYGMSALYVFALKPPRATLVVDAIVATISLVITPVLILVFKQYGIAFGQMAGFAGGWLFSQHLLRQYTELHMKWRLLLKLILPIIPPVCIIAGGQVIFFSLFIVPLYIVAGVIIFLWILGRRLELAEWMTLQRAVPYRLAKLLDLVYRFTAKRDNFVVVR